MEYRKSIKMKRLDKFSLKKNKTKLLFYVFASFYVLWAIPFLNKGIDVTDVGYYMTKYRYIFDESVNIQSGSILFTEIIGGFLYCVSGEYKLLVLNIAGWFCYLITGIIVYNLFKRKREDILVLSFVILGMMYSCSWIRTFNYNALSMVLFVIILSFLLKGIEKDNAKYLLVGGILLGVNVFVRFPNGLQAVEGLVLIWAYGIRNHEWKKAFNRFFVFAAGGVLGGVISLAIASYFIGIDGVINSFIEVLFETSSSSSGHGLTNMVRRVHEGLEYGIQMWAPKLLILCGALFILYVFVNWIHSQQEKMILLLLSVMAGMLGIKWGWGFQDAHVMYEMLAAFFAVSSFFQTVTPKLNTYQSSIALVVLLGEFVLTIGTDNGWYYQSVFVIFPLTAVMVLWKYYWKDNSYKKYARVVFIFIILGIGTFGIKYVATNVYRDSAYEELEVKVNVPSLAGMKTTSERSESLENLNAVLKQYEQQYTSLAILGDCPLAYEFTELSPFFSNPWPDLQSFSFEKFKEELDTGIDTGNYPVVLFGNFDDDNYDMMDMEKKNYLISVMNDEQYDKVYSEKCFEIYVKEKA